MSRRIPLLLLLGVAACGAPTPSGPAPAGPAPTDVATSAASPSAASPSVSSPSAPVPLTLDALAEQPCAALGDEDTKRLGAFVAASEVPGLPGPSCQWGLAGALIDFTADPTADETADPSLRRLTVDTIAGHRALIGSLTHGNDVGYRILVAMGPNRSFRIGAVAFGPSRSGQDPVTVGKNVAAAVIRRLG